MDTIRLRTLTLKSLMKFGKYKDLTVYEVIYGLRKPNHIIDCYFNLSMVSFNEEVLDIVGIAVEYRISKPGKSVDKRVEFYQNRHADLSNNQKLGKYQRNLSKAKKKVFKSDRKNNPAKWKDQRRNQGKN